MSTFALVHGAWGSGWYWGLLSAELESRGHVVVAPDLPCTDPSASVGDYARTVVEAVDRVTGGETGDVAVVGHSLGGLTAPVVAALRPVGAIVMLCAVVPEPGKALGDQDAAGRPPAPPEFYESAVTREDGTSTYPAELAAHWLYHDCPPELVAEATAHLRPQGWRALAEPSPLERWPDVSSSYVLCTGDRILSPEWSRSVARERLGVEAAELAGSHSPMLSRPAVLADTLEGLVT